VPLGRHLEPARGVYAVTVRLPGGDIVPGVANIGRRPTVNEGTESRVEAHLFDWEGDLYGQEVVVALHAFLRAERKFASFDELRGQIAADAAQARDMLATLDPAAPRSA
ncbi:MAG: riboflavin kinase, partial [Gemmatimonadaceae bacterium]|nr:riboflavin kinase [Acetobacteraceae bacterium]